MFAQTFFIVWRESLEALLVIGILHAWLAHDGAGRGALAYLWGGVAAGLAAALALAFILTSFSALLPPEGQEYFQAALILTAAILIVQMVFWMRRHGKSLKRNLEQDLEETLGRGNAWGVFAIALIAVMREGAETVVFLRGIIAATPDGGQDIASGIAAALTVAGASYLLLQMGGRYLSWRLFFRLTEGMLLLLACALVVSASGYLVSFGLVPYMDPLWDSSFLLDDMMGAGAVIASLTGYRAMPDALTAATWILYWSAIALGYHIQAKRTGPALRSTP